MDTSKYCPMTRAEVEDILWDYAERRCIDGADIPVHEVTGGWSAEDRETAESVVWDWQDLRDGSADHA